MEVKIVKKGEFERYVYLINENPDDVFIVHEKLVDNTWVIIGKVVIPRIVMENFTEVNSSRSETMIELPYTQVDPWFYRTERSVINLSLGNLPIGSDMLSEGVREEFAAYQLSKMPMYENQLGSLRDEVDVRLLWGLGPRTENDNGDVSTPRMDENETSSSSSVTRAPKKMVRFQDVSSKRFWRVDEDQETDDECEYWVPIVKKARRGRLFDDSDDEHATTF